MRYFNSCLILLSWVIFISTPIISFAGQKSYKIGAPVITITCYGYVGKEMDARDERDPIIFVIDPNKLKIKSSGIPKYWKNGFKITTYGDFDIYGESVSDQKDTIKINRYDLHTRIDLVNPVYTQYGNIKDHWDLMCMEANKQF